MGGLIHGTAHVRGAYQVELTCRRCRQPFTPSAEAIRQGPPHYWFCPACQRAPPRGAKDDSTQMNDDDGRVTRTNEHDD